MFHILLAEDDDNLRNALSKSLHNAGYGALTAKAATVLLILISNV